MMDNKAKFVRLADLNRMCGDAVRLLIVDTPTADAGEVAELAYYLYGAAEKYQRLGRR